MPAIVQLSPISNIDKVAIVGDIDITNDSTKVINKMKQSSQIIFLNGDYSYDESKKIRKIGFRLYWEIIPGQYLVHWGIMM